MRLLRVIKGGAAALALMFLAGPAPARDLVGPAQVIDADSLLVAGQEIRLHGIDAPEWNQPCKLPDGGQFHPGREAVAWLKSVAEGRLVACHPEDRDRYKRVVATCYLDGRNLNQAMVAEGWALPYLHYSHRYAHDGDQAQIDKRGLHRGTCVSPSVWRRTKGEKE